MKELLKGLGFFTAIMTNNYIIFELGRLCKSDEIRQLNNDKIKNTIT
jgi:hypothetical protein